jgi:hypothetical protein
MAAALYVPREIEVLTHDSGEPGVVVRNDKRGRVASVLNSWRVDDEWWRDEISRHYFRLMAGNCGSRSRGGIQPSTEYMLG